NMVFFGACALLAMGGDTAVPRNQDLFAAQLQLACPRVMHDVECPAPVVPVVSNCKLEQFCCPSLEFRYGGKPRFSSELPLSSGFFQPAVEPLEVEPLNNLLYLLIHSPSSKNTLRYITLYVNRIYVDIF